MPLPLFKPLGKPSLGMLGMLGVSVCGSFLGFADVGIFGVSGMLGLLSNGLAMGRAFIPGGLGILGPLACGVAGLGDGGAAGVAAGDAAVRSGGLGQADFNPPPASGSRGW